ncbi:MAG TPA: hypothetical protein EYN79_10415 [Planctomycetes bacterium]|nr:hypothetical protein [Planctomycetota bacterium]HIN80444.1 hypothetical protein [Planctomycetota bacterium]
MLNQFFEAVGGSRSHGVLLAILLIAVGCNAPTSRTDPKDAVVVAKKITILMIEGVDLMTQAATDDSLDISNPEEAFQLLPLLLEAEKKFNEAVRLSPVSSGPRSRLGACRQAIALIHLQQYQLLLEKATSYREQRLVPPEDLTVSMIETRDRARDWLRKSTRVLEFYVDRLMAKYPEPAVFTRLEENYVYLEEWQKAENTVRRMVARFPSMSGAFRRAAESRVRQYRLRRLEVG